MALVLATWAAHEAALASPVLLRMEGVIDSGGFSSGPFAGAGPGDLIVLEWLFDSSTPNDSGDESGIYLSSEPFELTVGASTYVDIPENTVNDSGLAVFDNYYSSFDEFALQLTYPGGSNGLGLSLWDLDGTAFSGNLFPSAFDFADFEINSGHFFSNNYQSIDAYFVVTSLTLTPRAVPLPSSVGMAVLGLLPVTTHGRTRRVCANVEIRKQTRSAGGRT